MSQPDFLYELFEDFMDDPAIFIRILLTWILLMIRRKALTRNGFKDITVFCVP